MVNYNYGRYNKFNEDEQWIRITEGCPWDHPYCYEPTEIKYFGIPDIVRRKVKIMDMNLLCKSEALQTIEYLGNQRVDGRVVYYELICGIDYRFLTQKIADALKEARFKNIRLAWDWFFEDQLKIKDTIKKLLKAGYGRRDITVFMICNWRIPLDECLDKMELCKVWNVKICDCYYDNQISPNFKPIFWTFEGMRGFRKKVRKHNHLVNFHMDPEISKRSPRKLLSEIEKHLGGDE